MPDATYQPKVYMEQGGDVLVVKSGGEVRLEDGAKLKESFVIKTANYTVLASESGTTFMVDAADKVLTLPSTAAGLRYRFIAGPNGLSVGTGLSISPATVDQIIGNGLASVDNKDVINTGGTDREGDLVELTGDGVDGWIITGVIGTWAAEA